jgi:arylsulfatase A-like enzyme
MGRERTLPAVLGTGALTGLVAGACAGAIDAIWSWRAAAQFVPGLLGRVRFVAYTALSHAAVGALVALAITSALLVLSRSSRLGDLLRFALAEHDTRRDKDPRDVLAGLSLVLAGLPIVAIALYVAYRLAVPYLNDRHAVQLVVIVAMGGALAAMAIAIPIAFALARPIELGLGRVVEKFPQLASKLAPVIAAAVMIVVGLAGWAWSQWETARQLQLRGPFVALVGIALAPAAWSVARSLEARIAAVKPWPRRGIWLAGAITLAVAVLWTGGSAALIKAETNFTGLGGGIARALRNVLDFDRDGYSRFLGGGDCDDGDATIHPGAPEIPDDGIDQNCSGGDATGKPVREDPTFIAVPPNVPKDFNVLLVTIDTTRADHLGTYGYKRDTSPNIDKLAADGTVFVNGWAHAPSTRYSMPAILTGRLPLDVYYDYSVNWPGLLPKATTLAEMLKPLGFHTGAITNYEYFDPKRHFNQGFDEYDNSDAALHGGVPGKGPEESHGSSSKQQTDKAISYVERHMADRWFLWVHYYDPHYAYEPHPEVPSFGTDRMALYDGEIRFTDWHLGRLFDELKAKGLYDKTVVVITGDHGEAFGEHGYETHGYHLYETKVPLIIRVPGMAPRRATTPAGHVDIMPTLANLAGGAPTDDMMGRSLVDVLAGNDLSRIVWQQLSYENNNEKRGGVDEHCHVIYNVSPDPSWEVYRVDRDPNETTDLADSDECKATRDAVAHWYDNSTVPPGAADALLAMPPPIVSALDADLGTSVRLLAVDVPARVHAGDSVPVTWTFAARGRVASGWKLFVHVDGPGHVFVNGDHAPVRPFEWWRPGQFIRYTTTVAIPRGSPAGRYTVHVGMFRGTQRVHVTAANAKVDDDAVVAATFEVEP